MIREKELTKNSCIIQNEELNKLLYDALLKYFKSLPEERLLEIESYMSCD